MRVALYRETFGFPDQPKAGRTPLTAPINDLVAINDAFEYAIHLDKRYWPLAPLSWWEGEDDNSFVNLTISFHHAIADWSEARAVDGYRKAIAAAAEGRISAGLVEPLQRVTYRPGGPCDVPDGDLPALAAWALVEAIRLAPLRVEVCPLCNRPWVTAADQTNPYCSRPAPDVTNGSTTTCRERSKNTRFRSTREGWRRAYNAASERRRRGTITEDDWKAWRAANKPDSFLPYDEWRAERDARPSTDLSALLREVLGDD